MLIGIRPFKNRNATCKMKIQMEFDGAETVVWQFTTPFKYVIDHHYRYRIRVERTEKEQLNSETCNNKFRKHA